MNSKLIHLLLIAWVLLTSCSKNVSDGLQYLGRQPPTIIPEVFAPDVISKKGQVEFGSVFNEEATEFFYGVDIDGKSEILYSMLINGKWSEPEAVLPNEKFGYNDPFLSPDESRLYFISKRSSDGLSEELGHDIWYVERTENGWSAPINAGPNINSSRNEYYISFTKEGTMYFSSNAKVSEGRRRNDFDIYASKVLAGTFQKATPLGESINSPHYEADVFIDPAELYMIFCADRPEGFGVGDLYISFKNTDGTWTQSKNMGELINTERHELCPFVSIDGKYFFYTSNEDIYWVDAKIIEEYR